MSGYGSGFGLAPLTKGVPGVGIRGCTPSCGPRNPERMEGFRFRGCNLPRCFVFRDSEFGCWNSGLSLLVAGFGFPPLPARHGGFWGSDVSIRPRAIQFRDSGFRIRDSRFGIRDSRFGIRIPDSEMEIRDSGFGIRWCTPPQGRARLR
jgi:hypothetical protein